MPLLQLELSKLRLKGIDSRITKIYNKLLMFSDLQAWKFGKVFKETAIVYVKSKTSRKCIL
jgi:hypothetical protein